jgi:hypothetical protein
MSISYIGPWAANFSEFRVATDAQTGERRGTVQLHIHDGEADRYLHAKYGMRGNPLERPAVLLESASGAKTLVAWRDQAARARHSRDEYGWDHYNFEFEIPPDVDLGRPGLPPVQFGFQMQDTFHGVGGRW